MSGFVCDGCGKEHDIFGTGGADRFARELELEVLGRIPIEPGVRSGGDAGVPITSTQYPGGEGSPAAQAMREVARTIAGRVSLLAAPMAGVGSGTAAMAESGPRA
jgi:ATP-binding protein involved in chromosome partitioning